MNEETFQKEHVQAMLQEAVALCTVPFPNSVTGDQPLHANVIHLVNKDNIAFLTDLFFTHYELQHFTKDDNALDCITFVCGTVLARMSYIKTDRKIMNIDNETLKNLFNDAFAWSNTYTDALTEYWQIQCHGKKRLYGDLAMPFFTKMPIYHPQQYQYLETLEPGAFRKHEEYSNALAMTDVDDNGPHQLANLPIWLGQGPSITDSVAETVNCFIADLMEHHCHLVIANGNTNQQCARMAFPLTAVSLFNTPDFLNYFGAIVTDSSSTQIGPRNHDEPFVYETKDYHVTTKKLSQFSISNREPFSPYHNIETYSLDIKIKGRRCNTPYHIIVHNIQTPDNNPALLNHEQLMLLYKSIIKMKCEKQNTFVHCAAGIGRTGVMAYLLANLFVDDFPQDPLQAMKWLRSHRANLIVTPQQLEGAIRLSREMKKIHNEVLKKLQCKESWQDIYRHLNLIHHLDYCALRAHTKEKTTTQASFFHRKRKLITDEALTDSNGKKTTITQSTVEPASSIHKIVQEDSESNLTNTIKKSNH